MKRRKSLRLKGYDYSGAGLYFLTTITQARLCWFGSIADGQMHLDQFDRIAQQE